MASKLIKHLKYCIANDPSLSVLGHQWGFDEQLIPKALQNIGTLYSDYSLHDESHSKQILVNIERILGEDRIKLLTATDTWLLLEAAYWHDIGMVVTRDQFDHACNSSDFWEFLEQIKENPNHPLHELCQGFNFETKQWSIQSSLPFTLVQNFKGLFSEWFRKQHTQLSSEIVKSPWEKANLTSPRTELIPNRLFLLLGKICESHGGTFENLISDSLPYKEVGIGTEDCHPRYIASLLRLGDLLDIDDNRFCPVMMKVSGDSRSDLSKIHEYKHRAIRHFRLDSELIEIECECSNKDLELGIDSYLEATNWFKWLEEELKNQMTHWTKIAPNRELGLLPTLGRVNVKFTDKDYFIPEESRPEFGIDIKKAMNILQDLYTDQFVCIRELLQNSVDSTYIKIFIDNDEKWNDSLSIEQLKSLLDAYRIKISIKDISEGDSLKLKLSIVDKGVGISLNDFSHMMKIGGSKNNKIKNKIVNNMPKILQPSGTFGIGFQSVFLLSNKVVFLTKSSVSDEKLQVDMYNPLGDKQGLCTFKYVREKISYGTTLEVELTFDEAEMEDNKKLSVNGNFDGLPLSDRFIFDSKSMIKANVIQKINEFKKHSLVPIDVDIDDIVNDFIDIGVENEEQIDWKLINYKGDLYRFSIIPSYDQPIKKVLFKGQPVTPPTAREQGGQGKTSYFNLKFFSIYLDFLSNDASDWLTAQRNKIRDRKFDEFGSIVKFIVDQECNSNPQLMSAFAFSIISGSEFFIDYKGHEKLDNIWKNDFKFKASLCNEHKEVSVYNKNYLNASINGVFFGILNQESNPPKDHVIINTGNGTTFASGLISSINNQALFIDNLGYKFDYKHKENAFIYQYSKRGEKYIEDNYLASIFYCGHKSSGTRPLIPYSDDFEDFSKLFIEVDNLPRHLTYHLSIITPKMAISPFVLFQKRSSEGVNSRYEMHMLSQFCDKLINSEIILDISKDELEKLYLEFSYLIRKKVESSELNELKKAFED
ncbi:Chaperone protein HtpG [Vibrio cholerae]|nr:Chaperone protein HtpG [Vibrio cholerae]